MKIKKKIMSVVLVFVMVTGMFFSFGTMCSSAAGNIKIIVNNRVVTTQAEPYIKNNRTMLPVAELVSLLGGSSEWDGVEKKVTITYKDINIEMKIGDEIASVNDCLIRMDVAPEIKVVNEDGGGRTMVPLRFVAEAFNFDVDWDPDKFEVMIFSEDYDIDLDPAFIKVFLDGKKIEMDAQPYISNNRTMVPIAVIVESLGGTAEWEADTKTAVLALGDKTIRLTINSLEAVYNEKNILLDTPPVIKVVNEDGGGRTMVPVRFVAESFGFKVDWDADTSRVLLSSDEEPPAGEKKLSFSIDNDYILRNQKYSAVIIKSGSRMLDEDLTGISLTDPYRYYLDFDGYELEEGQEDIANSALNSAVLKVRSEDQDDEEGCRVIVDLDLETEPYVLYDQDGTSMMLLFRYKQPNTVQRYRPENYHTFEDGKYVVALDPGHGMTTGGKRSCDETLLEWEFNRDIAYRLKKVLEAKGVQCIMTVEEDEKTDISLSKRAEIANEGYVADIFVSIHANAYGDSWNSVRGWEIYYYKDGVKEGLSKDLAQKIQTSTLTAIPEFKDRGVKTENFAVIRETKMPSVLVEHGFYTNKEEVELLKDSEFRDRLVQADAEGIMAFLTAHK